MVNASDTLSEVKNYIDGKFERNGQNAMDVLSPLDGSKISSIPLSTTQDVDAAVQAARAGNTNPWPDGAILGKVVWKDAQLENWKAAIAPGEFVHAEFMFKDSKKYSDSYGWGWARWVGLDQKPFQKGAQVCTTCHTPVKNRDWVFTDPASFP